MKKLFIVLALAAACVAGILATKNSAQASTDAPSANIRNSQPSMSSQVDGG